MKLEKKCVNLHLITNSLKLRLAYGLASCLQKHFMGYNPIT